MFGISLISYLLFALIFASLSSTIAEDKGHGEFVWGLVGFLLGPIGLLAAAGLSDRVQRKYLRQIAENFPIDKLAKKSLGFDNKENEVDRLRKLDEGYMDNIDN